MNPQNSKSDHNSSPAQGSAPAAIPLVLGGQLRRSVLFMPATNQRAVAKASQLEVDAIILDLEDSVLPAQKVSARGAIADALKTYDFGQREVLVRINGLDTPWWQQDLLAAIQTNADGIVVPKIELPEQVLSVAEAMQTISESTGQAIKPLWIMLETPAGILASTAICNASPNLTAVLIGTADLGKELRIPHRADRLGLLASLSQVVLAARAAGLTVLDGVFMDIKDSAGLETECEQGVALGFDGKSLIHPGQLAVTNRVFAPSALDLKSAQEILAAWQQSQARGEGVCVVNNRLVEHLHVSRAQEIVAMAQMIEQRSISVS